MITDIFKLFLVNTNTERCPSEHSSATEEVLTRENLLEITQKNWVSRENNTNKLSILHLFTYDFHKIIINKHASLY